MEITDDILSVTQSEIRQDSDGNYVVDVPKEVVENTSAQPGHLVRVAVMDPPQHLLPNDVFRSSGDSHKMDGPEFEEGDQMEVEIVSIGDKGDGIAKDENGFVIMVPGTQKGDRVTIEISNIRNNFANANVVEYHDKNIDSAAQGHVTDQR